LIEGKTLADDAGDGQAEAFAVGQLAIIEPEGLFIEVAEQVKRFDRNIGAVQTAFQKRPEIFAAISMDVAANIFDGMVNDFMLELVQAVIRF
jgi:hypothetical protein